MTDDVVDDSSEVAEEVLVRVFDQVEAWLKRIHADAPTPEAGSSLRGDDQATSPFRLSQAAYLALLSAVDHFEAVRRLVQEAGVVPARAAFTLLRAVLENAAITVWLLAPWNRNERVVRLLRLESADADDEAQGLAKPDSWLASRISELRELGRARALSQDQLSQIGGRKLRYSSIVRTAGDAAPDLTGDRAIWAWTTCSGLTHARMWAVLGFLKKDVSPGEAADVSRVRLSATLEQVAVMANIAATMLAEGFRLFDERCRAPAR